MAPTRGWNQILANARRTVRLTQRDLAERVGAPPPTVRSYERGAPRPPRPVLERIMDELRIVGSDRNAVLEGAGYTADPTFFPNWRFPGYFLKVGELPDEVEHVPWPCFVLN